MYVPNYVPEPLEVPGNVTLAPYQARVRFIRQVTFMHLIGIGLICLACTFNLPNIGLTNSLAILTAVLLVLDVVRVRLRGRSVEAKYSSAGLPIVLGSAALAVSECARHSIPVWTLPIGPLFCGVYTIFCGRDYSFVGCFFLSFIATSTAIAAASIQMHLSSQSSALALFVGTGFLLYFVYDLASLMARRRTDEAVAAVVDLYRDVFNFFGYFVRVVRHWKQHKIWLAPK